MYKPADLPLNERGAVYHLNLLPDELADTVITVGDPDRVSMVSKYFDRIEVKRSHREFVTHTGYVGNKRLSVLSTGIGMPNIDIVMNELDALVNIDLIGRTPKATQKSLQIIRLGTTGGIQKNCRVGDLYISRYAVGFNSLLGYYQNKLSPVLEEFKAHLAQHLNHQSGPFYVTEAALNLVHLFQNLGTECITVTAPGFYGPQGRALRVPLAYPNLLERLTTFEYEGYQIGNLEMETAGILGLGQLFGHQCVSISVVIANRHAGIFSENVSKQVDRLIEEALPKIMA